jgi:hypothetical protein
VADEIHSQIKDAVATGDSTQFEQAVFALSMEITYADGFPDRSFEFILELLQQRTFLDLQESHYLLMLFDIHWEDLSDMQKELLLPALEAAYDKFKDWMSWFVISELLGEHFTNDAALQTARRLRESEVEGPRSLVPHVLEHLILSDDEKLAGKAYKQLLTMKADPSEQVRDEVAQSLRIAARRGMERTMRRL